MYDISFNSSLDVTGDEIKDGKQQASVPVSPQGVGSLRTITDTVVVPQNSCFLSSSSNDAATQELYDFLVELNRSSALGLTASEVESLVTVSANVLNFGSATSDIKPGFVISCLNQCCLKRNAEGQAKCNCHLISEKAASSEFQPAVPGSVGQVPVAKRRKEDTTSSCRTLSLVIPPRFIRRKRSQAWTCTHELFPHFEPEDEKHKVWGPSEKKLAHDNIDSGLPKSSGLSSSDECMKFQCRVICLSEREHLTLCKYEKATENFDKLNRWALQQGSNLKLFLLRRKPEVHVCGERFDEGRLELLREIRRATLWWASRRNNPRTQLPVLGKPDVNSAFTPSSSTLTATATPGSAPEYIARFCSDFPDCKNVLDDDGSAQSSVCLPVLIRPRQKHSILIAYEKKKKMVDQLTTLFKFEGCEISLLRRKPMFHVGGSKPGSVTVFMLQQLVQRASSEQEIGKWLMERAVLPVVPSSTPVANDGAAVDESAQSSFIVATGRRSPFILCPISSCTNTPRREDLQGTPFTAQACRRVKFSDNARHAQFLNWDKDGWIENQLAEICNSTNRKVRVCLLKKLPEFHIYDPEDRFPSLRTDLEVLIDLCVNEFDTRVYVDRVVRNTLNPWVCADYPDCTNSNETQNEFKFFSYTSARCRFVHIPQELQQFLLNYPVYREKIMSEFFKVPPNLGAHQLRICLLRDTNAFHVRCSKHGLESVLCDAIQSFFKTYGTVTLLREMVDLVERSPSKSSYQAQRRAANVWVCKYYPDCTNSRVGEMDDGNRCRPVPILRWKQEKVLEFGYKPQLEAYFHRFIENESRRSVRICLLKDRNVFHVRGNPSHQDIIQKKITETFNDFNTTKDLISKLSKL